MKITISKKSWHYRFLDFIGYKHKYVDNFCDYFKIFLENFIPLVFFVLLVCSLVLTLTMYVYLSCVQLGLHLSLISLGAITAFVFTIYYLYKIIKTNKYDTDYSPNIFKLKYIAIKEKYCPKIEFID